MLASVYVTAGQSEAKPAPSSHLTSQLARFSISLFPQVRPAVLRQSETPGLPWAWWAHSCLGLPLAPHGAAGQGGSREDVRPSRKASRIRRGEAEDIAEDFAASGGAAKVALRA